MAAILLSKRKHVDLCSLIINDKINDDMVENIKGSVGYVLGGIIKVGIVKLFWSNEKIPIEVKKQMENYYGKTSYIIYTSIENPEEWFNKIKASVDKNLYSINDTDIIELPNSLMLSKLKEITGAKHTHRLKGKTTDNDENI